ncbi:MAG: D-2-hydroxyacid dehydrogenase [Litorilinea sp.]
MQILVYYPFTPEQVQAFRELGEANGHQVHFAENEDQACAVAKDVEVILGYFPPAVCAAAPGLRWIQSFSAGMDKFLFPEIIERDDVMVSNVAGLYASQGAEHAWAFALALARQIPLALNGKKEHSWTRGMSVVELTGGTLGIIGMGGFGIEMVKRAQGYDMDIIAVDAVRTEAPAGVQELLPSTKENIHSLIARSDVVMTACPLTAETYHLIGEEEFKLMKPTAYFVHVTRGGIVDEPALVRALEAGELAGAGLDVTEIEPLPADSPLWDAPNLILTPHRAGGSQHRPRKIFEFFMANLERYLGGERPVNVVDKRRGF